MFNLYFITSSRSKLMHAQYLARDYDVLIVPKKNYGIAYSEPRIEDRDKLLEESLADAKKRWFKNVSRPHEKMFFIEDTSVIIHALSKNKEVPGVDVKYWMKDNDFSSVDALLRTEGNNRYVTVRSDILLYLSRNLQQIEDKEFIRFTSSSNGMITEEELNFKTNPLYPWLDNKTFNKWFVPNGCNVPISMLLIEMADKYDFRAGAFKNMFEFLEKHKIIRKKSIKVIDTQQKKLPGFQMPVFLVCGLPCAGKTTIGTYLTENLNYYHIEASDFMYLSYYQHHGINSSVNIADFAEQALEKTPSIVVDQIIENIREVNDMPIIITGFRSPKEIELFIQQYEGSLDIKTVYIEADESKRFERCVKRNREEKLLTIIEFRERDKQQLNMGLANINKYLIKKTIFNNKDINSYIDAFLTTYNLETSKKSISEMRIFQNRPTKLENATLITLISNKNTIDKYFTTTEIAHLINTLFQKASFQTSKNNVSRYFNKTYHPYYEIFVDKGKIKYRLSHTGISKALILLSYS